MELQFWRGCLAHYAPGGGYRPLSSRQRSFVLNRLLEGLPIRSRSEGTLTLDVPAVSVGRDS
jgi:hypothetical protein